jgi:hypothetical protein
VQLLLFWDVRLQLQRVEQRRSGVVKNPRVGSPLRLALSLLVACLSTVLGLGFVFSDLGPGETGVLRAFSGAVFFLGTSGLIASLSPRFWYLALLPSAGPVWMAAFLLWFRAPHARPTFALFIGVTPLLLTVVGGLLGRTFGRWLGGREITKPSSDSA